MASILNVGRIAEGFVLDHIQAGKSMEIYKYLNLGKLDCTVAIIKNARSAKMGKKDIMKIECPIDYIDLEVLGFIDHNITVNIVKDEEIVELKANVVRLQEFEQRQLDFQRIRNDFLEEVVYAENGPGPEGFQKYYEAADPSTAQLIYRQVIIQQEETKEIQDWASAYSQMKPKQAAAILEEMTDDLDVAARILKTMDAEDRGAIMGVMDSEIAARLTKLMEPES